MFTANGIRNNSKVAVLMTLMGQKVYKKLRILCKLNTPDSKMLDELIMKEGGDTLKAYSSRLCVPAEMSAAWRIHQ